MSSCLERRRLTFRAGRGQTSLRYGRHALVGLRADNVKAVSIERLCLSPRVEKTLNSKVIKFRTWTNFVKFCVFRFPMSISHIRILCVCKMSRDQKIPTTSFNGQNSTCNGRKPNSHLNGLTSTDSFQNPQILRTISSGHDIIHTPAPFPFWGFIITMVIVISFAYERKTAANNYAPELLTRIVQSPTKLNDKIQLTKNGYIFKKSLFNYITFFYSFECFPHQL